MFNRPKDKHEDLEKRLKELLQTKKAKYCPVAGTITSGVTGKSLIRYYYNAKSGQRASVVLLERTARSAAQIAWLLHTGELPREKITLLDGTPHNIKWENISLHRPYDPATESLDDFVRSAFRYEPETGRIYRIRTINGKAKEGDAADTYIFRVDHKKYRMVSIAHGYTITAQRLAWFLQKGEWVAHTIRPINGDTLDVRWENLHKTTDTLLEKKTLKEQLLAKKHGVEVLTLDTPGVRIQQRERDKWVWLTPEQQQKCKQVSADGALGFKSPWGMFVTLVEKGNWKLVRAKQDVE